MKILNKSVLTPNNELEPESLWVIDAQKCKTAKDMEIYIKRFGYQSDATPMVPLQEWRYANQQYRQILYETRSLFQTLKWYFKVRKSI
jgi:hypothetical protein